MPKRNRFDIWLTVDLSFGNKENNKFCAIFLKALKGNVSKSEIRFAEKYARNFLSHS